MDAVESYLPLVRAVVGRFILTLPSHHGHDDLYSAGTVGLLQAMRGYRGGSASFETYATFRIRGEVLDELRRMDWTPRSIRTKAARVAKATAGLAQQLGRVPDDHEIAEVLGTSLGDFQDLLDEVRPANMVYLDSEVGEDELTTLHEFIPGNGVSVHELVSQRELMALVRLFIEHLTPLKKKVLALYYVEGLNQSEISKVLNLTESRISQIHNEALTRIRKFIKRFEAQGHQ